MGEVAKKKASLAKAVFSGSLGNMLEWFGLVKVSWTEK